MNKIEPISKLKDNLKKAEATLTTIKDSQAISLVVGRKIKDKDNFSDLGGVLESISDAFFSLDRESRLAYVNKQAEYFLSGQKREELLGLEIFTLFPRLKSTRLGKSIVSTLRYKKPKYFEEYFKDLNKWYDFRIYSYKDGVSVYFRDITAEKETHARVLTQYKVTSELTGNVPFSDVMPKILKLICQGLDWEWGAYWEYTGKYLAFKHVWYSPDLKAKELKLKSQSIIIKPGEGLAGYVMSKKRSIWAKDPLSEKFFQRKEPFAKAGLKIAFAFPVKRKSEITGVIEFFSTKSTKPQSETLRVLESIGIQVGQYMDKVSALENLVESENRYRLVVENALDTIAVFDLSGKYIYVSPSTRRITGFKPSDLVGTNVFNYVHPEDVAMAQQTLSSALSGKRTEIAQVRVKHAKGHYIIMEGSGSAILDENKIPKAVIGAFRDITLRVEQEKRKDEFISMASHELRTPVTSLKVLTQVLENRLKNKRTHDSLEIVSRIDNQTDRLAKLINDLLDLSRIQSGKLKLNKEEFDINAIAVDTVDIIQKITDTHKIKLTGKVKSKLYGDKDRINQVLINLINNAIKYSPESPKVEVYLSQKNGHATVSVRDYGIGISRDDQEKIFNRFYQVSDPRTKGYPGLGIGLYISSQIAKRHSGTITVDSEKGKGSTFRLMLPTKNN